MRLRKSLSLVLALILVFSAGSLNVFASAGGGVKTTIQIVALDHTFDGARPFHSGIAVILKNFGSPEKEDYKSALIGSDGKLITEYMKGSIEYLGEGLFSVDAYPPFSQPSKLMNKKGEIIKTLDAYGVKPYSEGLASVSFKGTKSSGYIDTKGNVVVPQKYDYAGNFSEGYGIIRDDSKHYVVDSKGQILKSGPYDWASAFSDGLCAVQLNKKYGLINTKGDMVIAPAYDYPPKFLNGYAVVKVLKEKQSELSRSIAGLPHPQGTAGAAMLTGLIDKTGKVVIPLSNFDVVPLSEHLYCVYNLSDAGSLVGSLVDNTNKTIIASSPDHYKPFSKDYAVRLKFVNGLPNAGLVDNTGRTVLPNEYSEIKPLVEDRAVVGKQMNNESGYDISSYRYGVLNEKGELIVPLQYEMIEDYSSGYALVQKNGKWGYIDKEGKEVVACEFDKAISFSEGMALARDGSQWYLLRDQAQMSDPIDGENPTDNKNDKTDKIDQKDKTDKNPTDNKKDKVEELVLPTDEFSKVTDKATAIDALNKGMAGLTEAQKKSPAMIDLLSLFGEELTLKASATELEGTTLVLNQAGLSQYDGPAMEVKYAIKEALDKGGMRNVRILRSGILFKVKEDAVNVTVETSTKDILSHEVRIEAPSYSLTLGEDFLDSLKEDMKISVKKEDSGVQVQLSGEIKEPVKLSLKPLQGDHQHQAVFDSTGKAIGGKYNPVTKNLDVKIKKSGIYIVRENEKSFSDIKSKPEEMQKAINILASKGIITGTGQGKFSPDFAITRAEIAALILRMTSKLDENAVPGFTDVRTTDWYYSTVASAEKREIMKGVGGFKFAPNRTILKDQIVTVASRVLASEMDYIPSPNPGDILADYYSDSASIPEWAQFSIALAMREELVQGSKGSSFNPQSTMTRGDVAVILHRLFNKLW